MNRRPAAARRGLTLLEVLVCLAIFAGAAAILAGGYVNVLLAYERQDEGREFAPDLVFAREQVLALKTLDEVRRGGDLPRADNQTFRWSAVVEPGEIADVFQVQLQVEIRRAPPRAPFVHTQVLWLLRPEWSEAPARDRLQEEFRRRIEGGRR